MNYEIKKGIPIPPPLTNNGRTAIDPNSFFGTLSRMEVGDCIETDKKQTKVGTQFRRLKPKRFTTRKTELGCNVWRIE